MRAEFTLSSITILLTILLLSLSCSNKAQEKSAETTKTEAPAPATPTPEVSEEVVAIDTVDTPTDDTPTEVAPTTPDPTPSPAPSGGSGKAADGAVSDVRMSTVMEQIARDLEADSLAYRSDLGQDCSGIYHKIKDMIQRRISVLGDASKYHYPQFNPDRSSRQIANWYHQHGNLHIVQNAMADRNRIRPGSVMFFGRTDEPYSNIDIAKLSNADKFVHDGNNGKIMHIAVVTSVEQDDAGNVTKYTMMHGRNSRYTASRSAGNWDGPGNLGKQHAKFPFGNWNQQWVAVADIATVK